MGIAILRPGKTLSRAVRTLLACATLLSSLTLLNPQMLSGQSATTQKSAAAAPASSAQGSAAKTTHPIHKRATAHHKTTAKSAPQAVAAAPVTPPAPPPPNWPANQPANPATVTWDSKGLEIEASNSSLEQILNEVATNTGAKLQGLNQDQRVFGTYGPGPAREVISKLLDGTGYNLLMIGGQGDAAPQQIILSKSLAGTPAPANNAAQVQQNNDEDQQPYAQLPDVQEQQNEQQTPHPPIRNPFGNGAPPRTPEEVQQEILRQQQQLQQQPDQSQQNNPQ
jgi:hypothetical protein